MDGFQKALAFVLERCHISQADLARGVDTTPQNIHMLVRGVRSGGEAIRRRIAEAFGYRYDDFLNLGERLASGETIPMDELIGIQLQMSTPRPALTGLTVRRGGIDAPPERPAILKSPEEYIRSVDFSEFVDRFPQCRDIVEHIEAVFKMRDRGLMINVVETLLERMKTKPESNVIESGIAPEPSRSKEERERDGGRIEINGKTKA